MAAKKKIVDKKQQRANVVQQKKEFRKSLSGMEKKDRISALLAAHPQYVQRASEFDTSYMLRRPTGLMSMDIGLGGGWPAAAASVLVGPDGAGKDYLLWKSMAESQQIYQDDFAAAVYLTEFLPDKRYIRDKCGLKIGLSDREIDEINLALENRGRAKLTDEQAWHYQETIGSVLTITGATAEVGFDRILDFTQTNACQIVAVNSIGFLYTEVKDAMASMADNPQQRNEAVALTKFITHLATMLNRGGPDRERNETSVLLINQMRSKDASGGIPGRILQDKDKMKPAAEAWALKHGKAIELSVWKDGPKLYDGDPAKGGAKIIGQTRRWEVTKGKLGTHEGKKGTFDYYFDKGADHTGDLLQVGLTLGVIEKNGAWLEFADAKVQGEDKMRAKLDAQPDLREYLKEMCIRKTPLVFRTS